ncbi:MAG: class I SAM-dependent methyltransferase [Patescibacteria group bacterium]
MNETGQFNYFAASLMPQAKFLKEIYYLAVARYQLAKKFVKGKIVLDAGCGAGYGTALLAKAGAKKVYGLDFSLKSIAYCQSHYQRSNLIFQRQDLTKIEFPDHFFDCIVIFETIEHIQDFQKAIGELNRVLKPGGKILISTPNKAVYSPNTKKVFYPFHYHEFYLEDFQKILACFNIESIKGQYIRGRKMFLYRPWDPRRILRIIYANLPLLLKILITKGYLNIYYWLYEQKILPPSKLKLADVYFSEDLKYTRVFVAICTKEKKSDE